MSSLPASCGAFLMLAAVMLPSLAHAHDSDSKTPETVDTEHIFAFAEGADIGEKGESEFEITATGRISMIRQAKTCRVMSCP